MVFTLQDIGFNDDEDFIVARKLLAYLRIYNEAARGPVRDGDTAWWTRYELRIGNRPHIYTYNNERVYAHVGLALEFEYLEYDQGFLVKQN